MSYLYIFLDESGNFDFSPKGTRYFILTSVSKERPFFAPMALHNLRYDLIEAGSEVSGHFHATEDKQVVRNAVFNVIRDHLAGVRIDSLIVEKAKTVPPLQEVGKFYPLMLGYLLSYVLQGHDLERYRGVLIFLSTLHTGKQKAAIEKAVKITLSEMLPTDANWRIIYQSSKANFDLQIADYCTWAIMKKWTSDEARPYSVIAPAIRGEFDFFRTGTARYY